MSYCYLHIGAPKTGSTALEVFLKTNFEVLRKHGWHYPKATLRGFGHHDLGFLVTAGYPDWALPQDKTYDQLVTELRDAVSQSIDENVILSSENFYLQAEPSDVANMLADIGFDTPNIRIVVYVRRQDEAHLSWYNQKVKAQGFTGTISQCIEEFDALWDYDIQLNRWADAFGSENLQVRPYQSQDLAQRDICRDFLSLLPLTSEEFEFQRSQKNARINRDILEYQRQINRLPLSILEKRRHHEDLIQLTKATLNNGNFSDAPLLSSLQRKQLVARYSKGNRTVSQRFLGRDELFNDNYPEETGEAEIYPGLTSDALAQITGWLMHRH